MVTSQSLDLEVSKAGKVSDERRAEDAETRDSKSKETESLPSICFFMLVVLALFSLEECR